MTKNEMINKFFHDVEVETNINKEDIEKELYWLARDINRCGIDAVMNQMDFDTVAAICKVAAATLSGSD
jgi:hypothetical protein